MFIQLGQHTIHYERYGNGPELLCCLPGYGETGSEFLALAHELQQSFTIIAPDLPLHGETRWQSAGFNTADLHQVLQALATREGFTGKSMALAGYSMGGRLAMAYATDFPAFISRLILLAPDGLHQNFWYWFSTKTFPGNRLFARTMANPSWLFFGMKWGRKMNLLNQSIVKFSHRYLDDASQRKNLYERWTLFRGFTPNLRKLKKIISRQPLPVLLVFGHYDRIIPPALGKKLHPANNAPIHLAVIEAGHRLLKQQFAPTIATLIASSPA
jgi:pimeloyl-ACP methyl ester carboxylesterase